jgi:AraC-like DNA-binding protein
MGSEERHPVRRGSFATSSHGDFYRLVSQVVAAALAQDGPPGLPMVARRLRTSRRTLQRRLGIVGLTYASILQQVRCQLAEQMLTNSGRKIGDVARALGYTDPGHFTRAFRRWTGLTPRDFRRRPRAHAAPQIHRRRARAARRASARAVAN